MHIRLANAIKEIIQQHRLRYHRTSPLGHWRVGRLLALLERLEGQSIGATLIEVSRLLAEKKQPGWTCQKLRHCMQFYRYWPSANAIHNELSWSHYQLLLKIKNHAALAYYHQEAIRRHWTTAQLKRQIISRFFERNLPQKEEREVLFKENYILEFTELPDLHDEKALEEQLLLKVENTLLELGHGFGFIARQRRIVTPSGKQFFIDLVFYNTQLNAYVLVDLKKGELAHRDLGQMDAYLRLYDNLVVNNRDVPSYGLILCTFIDPSLKEYSLLKAHPRIHGATYSLQLPRIQLNAPSL